MKLYLIVAKGKHQGMPIPIKVDLFMMGSDEICQLKSKLPGIAPQHCALVTREKKVFICDLEGGETLVNNELMPAGEEWPVHGGDRLSVGPLEFMIQFHEKQLSQRDAEEWALKSLDQSVKDNKEELDEEGNAVAPAAPQDASSAAAAVLDKLSLQRGVVKGRLRVSLEKDVTIMRFNDVYLVEEAEIAFIKKEVQGNLKSNGMRVLLDFKNVKRMSSAGAEMILDIRRRLRTIQGVVAMCRVRPELHVVLEALNIFDQVRHFADKAKALEEKW
jgi:anti-anti-sigma regulatory factor